MGVPNIIAGGISVISGLSQARSAKRASRKAQQAIAAAPGRALGSLAQFESRFGGPPGFERLAEGDYDALQQAIFEQQAGLLQPGFEDAQRRVYEDAARRGLPSSIISETQEGLGRDLALGLQQAAAGAVGQRYGLQSDELARLNALRQQQFSTRLGAFQNLAGMGTQGAAAAGQIGQTAVGQVGGALSGIGSAFGGLLNMHQNRQFQNQLLSALGGGSQPQVPGQVSNFLNNYSALNQARNSGYTQPQVGR